MREDPSRSIRALVAVVKHITSQSEQEARVNEICKRPRQGQFIRSLTRTGGRDLGNYTRSLLPESSWKFVNAAHNTISIMLIYTWHKKQSRGVWFVL